MPKVVDKVNKSDIIPPMAINLETLTERPKYPEKPAVLPVEVSEDVAAILLEAQINEYSAAVPQSFTSRFRTSMWEETLVRIDKKNGGWLRSSENGHPGYTLDPDALQGLAIAAMQKHGLDVHVTIPGEADERSLGNGVKSLSVVYPSQTVKGLAFRRTHEFIEATGDTVLVEWELMDIHTNSFSMEPSTLRTYSVEDHGPATTAKDSIA